MSGPGPKAARPTPTISPRSAADTTTANTKPAGNLNVSATARSSGRPRPATYLVPAPTYPIDTTYDTYTSDDNTEHPATDTDPDPPEHDSDSSPDDEPTLLDSSPCEIVSHHYLLPRRRLTARLCLVTDERCVRHIR
jgi:hypothetical protein